MKRNMVALIKVKFKALIGKIIVIATKKNVSHSIHIIKNVTDHETIFEIQYILCNLTG